MIWQKIFKRKKLLAGLLAVALAAAGAAVYYQRSSAPVATEAVAAVGRGDIRATVSATGTISAVNSVEISSRVTGLITELRVKENDIVKAGQVLVVLDDTAARAQLAQYRAQLTNYTATYERSKKLTAIGAQSTQQLDSDRTNYLVSQANYDNYASQLDYYVIKSPIDGIVVGTPTPAGQTVAQGISSPQVIMTVADLSKMKIKVMVDESDIGKVKLGQAVSFTVDAYVDKTFTGTITLISRSATTTSNVVYYPVYVEVASPEGLLYPSMTARVTINVGESRNALLVPLSAVKEEKGRKYVQVSAGGKSQNVLVETGLSDDENIEIKNGLSDGDQIILPVDKPKTGTTSSKNQGPPPPI
jgi:HlyD family secretion protein